MQRYRHILFATDLSPMTEAAAMRAAELARRFRAQLTLLHVIEHFLVDAPNDPIPPENVDPATFIEADARNRLGRLVRRIGRHHARQRVVLSACSAPHAIVEAAREIGADLIVLASNGSGHASHLLRSTPCVVLHDASCDVLVLRLTGANVLTAGAALKRQPHARPARRR